MFVCILAAHPVAEGGIIDDWAYIWAARALTHTGHLVYTGWATAMLTWQLYLGALFIKLFGFSFTVVRASVILLSLISTAILHRILLRLGFEEWNASIVTLCTVLSPLFLPLAATFMSDIPGFFALIVCVYCSLRAVQAESDSASLWWLVAAAIANDLLGTVRQISWLGALVLVPSTGWCIRRRRGVPIVTLLLWLFSVLFIAGCTYWYRQQPYSLSEPLLFRYPRHHLWNVWILGLAGLLLSLPVLGAYLIPFRRRFRPLPLLLGAATGCIAFLLLDKSGRGFEEDSMAIAPYMATLPRFVKLALEALSFAALFSFAADWFRVAAGLGTQQRSSGGTGALSGRTLLVLLGPFTCAYMLLVLTRAVTWQRYIIPVLPVALVVIVWVYMRSGVQRRLPAASAIAVGIMALLGTATAHDLFAGESARVSAVNELVSAGVPRTAIEAGAELDGWVQLDKTGYVNDHRLVVPAGAYRPRDWTGISRECHSYFLEWTPSFHPLFQLSGLGTADCFPQAPFPPILYRTWLPSPNGNAIYILAVQNR